MLKKIIITIYISSEKKKKKKKKKKANNFCNTIELVEWLISYLKLKLLILL